MVSRASLGARWAILAGCLIATGAQAQNFVVRAGNGATLGPIVATDGAGNAEIALLDVSGDPLRASGERVFQANFDTRARNGFIEVRTDGAYLRHPFAPYVFFDRAGCAGQAFVSLAATTPERDVRAAIVGSRSELYLVDEVGAHLYQVASRRYEDVCTSFVHVVRAYPAYSQGSLADSYPPPYVAAAVQ